ncbi:MAG: hypothetical protein N3D85_04530 [Candidatus Bathyarchaeota archaeon]|nr:hypothetical protein [Candidatus Bathyarchaeota archaeon]
MLRENRSIRAIAKALGKTRDCVRMKIARLGLEVVVHSAAERTTTTSLEKPSELPSVEEALKTLSAALKAWETPGLDQSETLPLAGTPYVEMIAVMAKYSPFAEKADMRKVAEQQTVKSVSVVSETLLELGFDLQLLGSERHVTGKLENLTPQQLERLKEAFGKCAHPRFKKEFAVSRHRPFGKQLTISSVYGMLIWLSLQGW